MQAGVGVPLGVDGNHCNAWVAEGLFEGCAKCGTVLGFAVIQAVEFRRVTKIQAVRGAEQVFERRYSLGLRQEREDAATIVVQQHDRHLKTVPFGGEQAIHIVVEGQIANHQYAGAWTHGTDAQGG